MSVVCVDLQREPVPDEYSRLDPEHKVIYRFVRTLFSAAQLTAECAIVTLVRALGLFRSRCAENTCGHQKAATSHKRTTDGLK